MKKEYGKRILCSICGEPGAGGLHKVVVDDTPTIVYQCNDIGVCDTILREKEILLGRKLN